MTTRRLLPLAVLALLVPAFRDVRRRTQRARRRATASSCGARKRRRKRLARSGRNPPTPRSPTRSSCPRSRASRAPAPSTAPRSTSPTTPTTAASPRRSSTPTTAPRARPRGFFRTSTFVIQLAARDSVHFDDMVQEMDDRGLLAAGAVNGSVGGLLVRFDGLPSTIGWEGSAIARLYNRVDENNPSLGTIGYAFPASLFFESAYQTAVGIARDTTPDALAGGVQGSQRTNIGIRNTDVHAPPGSNRPLDLAISFYDPATGNQVGNHARGAGTPARRSAHHRQRLRHRRDPADDLAGPRLRGPDESRRRAPAGGSAVPDVRGVHHHDRQRDERRLVLRDEVRRPERADHLRTVVSGNS